MPNGNSHLAPTGDAASLRPSTLLPEAGIAAFGKADAGTLRLDHRTGHAIGPLI